MSDTIIMTALFLTLVTGFSLLALGNGLHLNHQQPPKEQTLFEEFAHNCEEAGRRIFISASCD